MSKAPKLPGGSRFMPADFSINRYAALVPVDTTLDDVMHPDFFQNHLAQMRPGMVINVLSDDYKLDCDLRVISVSKTAARVRVLRNHADMPIADSEKPLVTADDLKVNWGGPQHKYRFMHAGSIVEHGFTTEAEANEAAAEYLKKING